MYRGASPQFKKQEGKEDKRKKPMKSFPENRDIIQVSLEKPQCFMIFLEETDPLLASASQASCPRDPSPSPLTDTHLAAPQTFIEHSGAVFSAIHPPAGRPSTSDPASPTLASLL